MKWILIVFFISQNIIKTNAQEVLIPYEKDNFYGFMNMDTQIVIPAKFVYVAPFAKNGLAKVMELNSKFGFINKSGDYVLPPKYSLVSSFNNQGFAFVYESQRYKIINKKGDIHLILPEDIYYIRYNETNSMGFVAAENNNLGEGFYSWSGKKIIPTTENYHSITFLDTNIILNSTYTSGESYISEYEVIDLIDSTKTWDDYIFRESFETGEITNTAFNNTSKKIDTFDYNLQVRVKRYYQNNRTFPEINNYNTPNIYLSPHPYKSFGVINTQPFNTFSSEEKLTDIEIKEDNLYLYPNKKWKSVLQSYNRSIQLNIEYYYKNNWILPYSVYPNVHGCFSKNGEIKFWEPGNHTGLEIKKPVLNQGDIEITTRFSIEVITPENDTTKIYSPTFSSKVYSGLLEHSKPALLNNMIHF